MMIGQGGPTPSLGRHTGTVSTQPHCWGRWRTALRLGLLWLLMPPAALGAEQTIRVRIAWGGGSERIWRGTIGLSEGRLAEPLSLGIEADEPGSMWFDGEQKGGGNPLLVCQRSPRSYDGVDLLLSAPPEAKLLVRLAPADDPERGGAFEFPLATLAADVQNKELDALGNRLLVHRAPGDMLRVELQDDCLVFLPGGKLKFLLRPHLLPVAGGSKVQVKVQLCPARSARELWSTVYNVQAGQAAPLAVEVPLGNEEGAYDVLITAVHVPNWQQAVRQPLSWKKTLAERSIQLLVLNTARPAPLRRSEPELVPLVPIDPANPRWWDLLAKLPQLPKIPRLWKAPLGNGHMQVWRHSLGDMVRLAPSADSPDVSWEAYTLPISQPGRPHVLEVDLPSDVPQTLGISILEPNAAGALMPIGLDSGVEVSAEPLVSRPPRWLRHRLIFWPRTTSPLVLMANYRHRAPAVFGKLRVLGGWEHLPSGLPTLPRQGQRLLAAYYHRPLFPENFSASEALDSFSGHSLHDWLTFYEGGTRLVEYLHHVGYNGAVVAVLADGSTIYPSPLLSPTPRFDKGVLFATGQDPVRKDVLEMLFRLFDREHLQLVPAVEFAAPLPELEAIVRRGGAEAEALQWIGPEGNPLIQAEAPHRGLGAYYNVLSPRVQQAMLAAVRELAGRYGHHPSFGGLGVQLSAHGYAQLPGPEWGLDDGTIARFQEDTQLQVPGSGARRFAQRAEFLTGAGRAAWLQWRADRLGRFHRQLQAEVAAVRSDARLYLLGATMFAGSESQLRPNLTRRTTLAEAMLRVGVDVQQYRSERGPVLLRSERFASASAPAAWAQCVELSHLSDADRCFQTSPLPGSLFFHVPCEVRVESFDSHSPFKPSYAWLVSQVSAADRQNRRRFVRSLSALDSHVMLDGGWLLPLGQEEATRPVLAAYRRLPAVRFDRVNGQADESASQPVTLRTAAHAGRTWLYAVNDAPFRVTVRVRVDAAPGCRLEELTGLRQVPPLRQEEDGTYWVVELDCYDLVAAQLSDPAAQFSQVQVSLPSAVEPALQQRIRELGGRTAALRTPPPWKVLANAGFERPATGEEPLPDWAVTKRPGVSVQTDKAQRRTGGQSARIASTGPVACLVSRPFAAPTTGRLSMSVWLRVADAARQPPLRLAIEGRIHAQPYYRYAEVGAAPGGTPPSAPIGADWTPYVFAVDDLPLEGLSQVRVRFDLMGAGEVWIDDVQLFDLAFSERERRELAKLITVAEYQLQNRQVGDCLRLLEGYWPRFLESHVPLLEPPSDPVAQKPAGPKSSEEEPPASPPPRTGMLERLKDFLPERLRF